MVVVVRVGQLVLPSRLACSSRMEKEEEGVGKLGQLSKCGSGERARVEGTVKVKEKEGNFYGPNRVMSDCGGV